MAKVGCAGLSVSSTGGRPVEPRGVVSGVLCSRAGASSSSGRSTEGLRERRTHCDEFVKLETAVRNAVLAPLYLRDRR